MDGCKKILMASSEAVPFVKTGGLGDVCGALPPVLKKRGHDARIVLPRYWVVDKDKYSLKSVMSMCVHSGGNEIWTEVFEAEVNGVTCYFIEHEGFFGRKGIYDDGNRAFSDNPDRYAFFCRACLQLCKDLGFAPDIIHTNDWPTALISVFLKTEHRFDEFFKKTASVFSIHNIGYQGVFPKLYRERLGLHPSVYHKDKMESFGDISFMKGAIFYSDAINTVSPGYADEILSPIGGNGLAPFLERRKDDLFGILNGVDYDCWHPEDDKLIPETYSAKDLSGKKICKRVLQQEFCLEIDPDIPVIGIVSRFAHQKGLDLLKDCIEKIVSDMVVQFAIIGSGEKYLEDYFGGLPARFSRKIGAWIGYNEHKAHLIEAGADFFIMPSLYEPCGLNQIYSLKYGTLPIVRATGGLKDTVDQYDEKTGEGTGFLFDAISSQAVYDTVGWAVSTYYDRPKHIAKMQQAGMAKHFSWDDSAEGYELMYNHAIDRRKAWG